MTVMKPQSIMKLAVCLKCYQTLMEQLKNIRLVQVKLQLTAS